MIYEAPWAQVKVEDFFQGYNWRGAAPVLESSVTEASLDAGQTHTQNGKYGKVELGS